MILAICFATATAEDSRESIERFNWGLLADEYKWLRDMSCTNCCEGVTPGNVRKLNVEALLESCSTFRNGCGIEKRSRNVCCGGCYTGQFFVQLVSQRVKLRDKLRERLPSVMPPLGAVAAVK